MMGKITDQTELTDPQTGDFVTCVDTSDTTQSANGTTKQLDFFHVGQDIFTANASGTINVYNSSGTGNIQGAWGDVIAATITGSDTGNPVTLTATLHTFLDRDVVEFSGTNGTTAPNIGGANFILKRVSANTFSVPSNCTVAVTTGTATVTRGLGSADHPGTYAGYYGPTTLFPMPLWPLLLPRGGGTINTISVRFANDNTTASDRVNIALYNAKTGARVDTGSQTYAGGGHKTTVTMNTANCPQALLVGIQTDIVATGFPTSASLATLFPGASRFGIGGDELGLSSGCFKSDLDVPSYNANWNQTWPATISNISGYTTSGYVNINKPIGFYAEWAP